MQSSVCRPKSMLLQVQAELSCNLLSMLLQVQAELSCNLLYVGPRVCCYKAIIADIACIVIVEVVSLCRQHQSSMHHGKPFPLVSAQKAKAALYCLSPEAGSPSGCSAHVWYVGTL